MSDDACHGDDDEVISIGGIFFIERFVCCMTKKSWEFSDLVAAKKKNAKWKDTEREAFSRDT